jgi:hypothetical protein
VLRRRIPSIVRLNRRLIPFLDEGRALASCTNEVLVPYFESPIPSGEQGNSDQLVREQVQRAFVGLSGESRTNDANGPWFRTQAVPPDQLALGEVEPVPPTDVSTPPPHRPDVPCETQEPPNLDAPEANSSAFPTPAFDTGETRAVQSGVRRYMRSDRYERVQRQSAKAAR